jgi:class 3 adenylate cyclase/DNA-binding SARP family transcriptional activator/tetratricopeptide (TPR) repeat protein
MSASLEVGLLGPLEIRRGGEQVRIAAPKQQALVLLLALEVGRVVSSDELADRLWAGDPPTSAVTALQVYISQLRKVLGAGVIVTRRPGYLLDLPPDAVDAVRFEGLVADGRSLLAAGDAGSAEVVLTEALSAWQGDALAEFVYEDWAAAPIRRLEELRLVALEDRIEAQLQLGQGAELTGELQGLVREHPLRERLRGQHMLALYRAGRQADALSAYQDARHALVEELGIDPSPALLELERRILQQDPALIPVARPRPASEEVDDPADAEAATPSRPASDGLATAARSNLCTECGAAVTGRFCSECGAALVPARPSVERQQRKLVTVLFCDVVGSTALAERLDAEVVRGVMNRFFDAASAVISRHGGSVEKFIGDAVVAMFGVPQTHEDDALRAVRAADEIHTAIRTLADETEARFGVRVETRIGVNTGEVVVGVDVSGPSMATGDTVNVAARLEQTACAGEILLGETTWQLVRDAVAAEAAGPIQVKGKAETIVAHRLEHVVAGAAGHARRMDMPLVGRGSELRLLRDSFERWSSERACGLVTVLGTAGVGKSRLVAEFIADLGEAACVVGGRCLSYGSGITYWPLAEAIRELAGIEEEDTPEDVRHRVAVMLEGATNVGAIVSGVTALIGVEGSDAGGDESAWALRRAFEHIAGDCPLVVVLDDLQWAEAPFLDLVDHLAETLTDAPVLLLCMARPELIDVRPAWGGGKLNATTILLEPLDPEHSDELVAGLLGGRSVPDELRVRVASAAAGNPLFAEELLAYLRERGHISVTKNRVTVRSNLDEVELPPTIRALIDARLDQLPHAERGALERGAVEGQVFHAGAVTALSDGSPACAAELQRLVRKQVLRPDAGALPGEEAFRFRHLLIRDATYDGIPKQQRAEWHREFAHWLEATVGQRVSEYEEILAYHYAAAYRYLLELGGDHAESLRDRAAALLRRSADRALAQGNAVNAVVVLDQLVSVHAPSHDERVVALADRAGALRALFRIQEADDTAQQAIGEAAGASPKARAYAEAAALPIASDVRRLTSGELMLSEATSLVQQAEDAGWHSVACLAWCCVAEASVGAHQAGRALEAAERARRHAASANMPWFNAEVDRWEALALVFGSTPVAKALARCNVLYPEGSTQKWVTIRRGLFVGTLLACQGDVVEGIRLQNEARDLALELGVDVAPYAWWMGIMLFEAGQPEDAIPHLIAGAESTVSTGDRNHASTDAASAAHALAQVGRYAEVGRFVEMARDWSAADDRSTQMLWRGALARSRAASGAMDEAEQLARAAVSMAEGTDFAAASGLALIDLAWVSLRAGKLEQARDAAERAVEILARRGAVSLRRQAEAILSELNVATV